MKMSGDKDSYMVITGSGQTNIAADYLVHLTRMQISWLPNRYFSDESSSNVHQVNAQVFMQVVNRTQYKLYLSVLNRIY